MKREPVQVEQVTDRVGANPALEYEVQRMGPRRSGHMACLVRPGLPAAGGRQDFAGADEGSGLGVEPQFDEPAITVSRYPCLKALDPAAAEIHSGKGNVIPVLDGGHVLSAFRAGFGGDSGLS